MDKIPDKIRKTILAFIAQLVKNNIQVDQAVLFGSYAMGTNTEYSDIDLAIVSDDFSGNRFLDKEMIRKHIVAVNTDISPVPFRPEDFTPNDFLVEEILSAGIRIT